MVEIKVKRLDPAAKLPERKHDSDAGFDLWALDAYRFSYDGKGLVIKTGLSILIPDGYVGLLFPRSSIVNTCSRLSNSVGVIDAGYTGEIIAKFDEQPFTNRNTYKKGERCLQLVVIELPKVQIVEVDEMPKTKRGDNGFGSTGKK